MESRWKTILWIALATLAAVSVLTSERNRLALSFSEGFKVGRDGMLLGVSVGMTADTAGSALQGQGLVRNTVLRRSGDGWFACYRGQPAGQQVAVYEQRTWRRGVSV